MNVLLDTNILSRMAQQGHIQYQTAIDAAAALRLQGDVLCLVPQVLYEFWAVATRPAAVNGLGFPVPVVISEMARLKSIFPLLPDLPSVFSEWERLVTSHQVTGKNSHDARLVAAMGVHGITHLLTFNTQDFARYPGVTTLDPFLVAAPPKSTP
ncbi:MAG: type II toxin-antitoxin system VapC family toxin [Planctomycetes bacterium]|nr:type II toxin-antitoxin system VapC family toxin [Planctomycetota bacterium]